MIVLAYADSAESFAAGRTWRGQTTPLLPDCIRRSQGFCRLAVRSSRFRAIPRGPKTDCGVRILENVSVFSGATFFRFAGPIGAFCPR